MNESKQSNLNSKGIIAIIVIIGLIIVFFFLLIDVNIVIEELKAADLRYLIAASLMLILGLFGFAARWWTLLLKKPSLLFTFHAANIGHAANILIPFRAGEPLRILVMGTNVEVSLAEATSSFVVERLFEQLMRLLALFLAIILGLGLQLSFGTIAGGVVFLILGFGSIAWLINHQEFSIKHGSNLLVKIPRVSAERARQAVSDLLENIEGVAKPREFIAVLFWSIITWGFFWGFFFLTLMSLNDIFPSEFLLPISLGALALSPPSAPTQPGIFHASIVVPLAALGFDAEKLTAYAVILHIVEMVLITSLAIWGIFATGFSLSAVRDIFRPSS